MRILPANFWRRISPAHAVDDFTNEWRRPTPHRWQILGVSIAATFAILAVFLPESERAPPARPQVTYITSWAPDRTEEEIVASNIENQMRKDRASIDRARLEERRRDLYRALGRATFIDVEAMEDELARESEVAQNGARDTGGAPGESANGSE